MPDAPIIVTVNLPNQSYPVEIGYGLLHSLGARLARVGCDRRATIISDSTVASLYGERVGQSLLRSGIEYSMLAVPPGDSSKSLEIAAQLYEELAAARHDRTQPVIAVGGGVVGDIAGFVAATWHRGVPFVQCPTSLEAMIDASIGGKTALNLPSGKNLIGAFHQPRLVCIDPECLQTLSPRDFCSGLAESVKHAVVDGADFLDWQFKSSGAILGNKPAALLQLIPRNCEIKATIITSDEREVSATGVGRAALNFGHSVGHAIESASAYSLRHGEAVAIGMVAEMDLAVSCSGFPDAQRQQVEQLLTTFKLPTRTSIGSQELLGRLAQDKKNRGDKVRFVLPRGLGDMVWLEAPDQGELLAAMTHICAVK